MRRVIAVFRAGAEQQFVPVHNACGIEHGLAREEPLHLFLLPAVRRCCNTGRGKGLMPAKNCGYAGLDIEARNSPFVFVLERRPSRSSMASTVERGLRTLRNTQMRFNSSAGSSSSSLRVPERLMSIVGNTRLSTRRRSRLISMLPVTLN